MLWIGLVVRARSKTYAIPVESVLYLTNCLMTTDGKTFAVLVGFQRQLHACFEWSPVAYATGELFVPPGFGLPGQVQEE